MYGGSDMGAYCSATYAMALKQEGAMGVARQQFDAAPRSAPVAAPVAAPVPVAAAKPIENTSKPKYAGLITAPSPFGNKG